MTPTNDTKAATDDLVEMYRETARMVVQCAGIVPPETRRRAECVLSLIARIDALRVQLDTIAAMPATVGEYVDDEIRERGMTADVAAGLAAAFGTSAAFWVSLHSRSSAGTLTSPA